MQRIFNRHALLVSLVLISFSFVQAMQEALSKKLELDYRMYSLLYGWTDERFIKAEYLNLQSQHHLKEGDRYDHVQLDACGGEVQLKSYLGCIDHRSIRYSNEQPRYLEEYLCKEKSYQRDTVGMCVRYDDCACGGSSLNITNFLTRDTVCDIKDFIGDFGVSLLKACSSFGMNKDFCILPVRTEDGSSHVYLFRFTGNLKRPLDIVVDLGEFVDPVCGDINDASTTIVVCDRDGKDTLHVYRLLKKTFDRIDF